LFSSSRWRWLREMRYSNRRAPAVRTPYMLVRKTSCQLPSHFEARVKTRTGTYSTGPPTMAAYSLTPQVSHPSTSASTIE
jgi:hypothetical protein